MKKAFANLLKAIDAICAFLLFMIFLLITVQIVCRFTPLTLTWTEELARICFVLMSYLAAPLCLAEGSHIAVDMVVNHLPAKIQRVVNVVIQLAICVFCVAFIKSMFVNIESNVGVTTVTMTWLPLNWIYILEIAPFVITFFVAAVQLYLAAAGKTMTISVLEQTESNLTEEDLGL